MYDLGSVGRTRTPSRGDVLVGLMSAFSTDDAGEGGGCRFSIFLRTTDARVAMVQLCRRVGTQLAGWRTVR